MYSFPLISASVGNISEVGCLDIQSAGLSLPGWYFTLKLNCCSLRHHLWIQAGWLDCGLKLETSGLWSVRMTNGFPRRYSEKSSSQKQWPGLLSRFGSASARMCVCVGGGGGGGQCSAGILNYFISFSVIRLGKYSTGLAPTSTSVFFFFVFFSVARSWTWRTQQKCFRSVPRGFPQQVSSTLSLHFHFVPFVVSSRSGFTLVENPWNNSLQRQGKIEALMHL